VPVTIDLREAPYAVWRALAGTVVVMVTATGAHSWAGGGVPEWPTLALLAGVQLVCGVLFLRSRVSLRVLLAVVALSQVMSHAAFAAFAPHDHHGGLDPTGLPGGASPWSWQMLLAHALATVTAAVVWRSCERAAEVVLVCPTVWVGTAIGQDGVPVDQVSDRIDSMVCLVSAPRRGPPAALLAVS
jgi:hypothetical protein